MFRPVRPMLTLAAWAASAFLAFGPAPASAQGIAVIVNGQPILSSEVQQRLALLKLSGGKATAQQAEDELITDKLKLAEAGRYKISASDEQVEATFTQIASRTKLTAAQFSQAIQQRGVTPAALKARLKAEMTWAEFIRRKYSSVIAARKTGATLSDPNAKPKTGSQWTVRQIIFVVPKGASDAQVNQRRSEAVAARSRFPGCDGAVQFASSLRDVAVKEPVTRTADQLGGFADVLAKTKVGALTEPQRGDTGIEMVAVCERKEVGGDMFRPSTQLEEADGKLLQEKSDQAIAQLKARAVIQRR